jgi:hypothetical protein
MSLINSFVKLIIPIALFIIMDYLLTMAIGWLFIWFFGLSTIWCIVVAILGSGLLVFFVSITAMLTNYLVFINDFKALAAILLSIYLTTTGIISVITFAEHINFEQTKPALTGTMIILYFVAKMWYGCRAAWLGRYFLIQEAI